MNEDIRSKIANLRELQSKLNEIPQPSFSEGACGGGIIGKIVKKCVNGILQPYEQRMKERIGMEYYLVDEIINTLTVLEASETSSGEKLGALENKVIHDEFDETYYRKETEDAISETVREVMRQKWEGLSGAADEREKDTDLLECKICGKKRLRGFYQTKETSCRFGGGRLVRYICPECGNIFGPTKFSNLTDEEKGADYSLHYRGYNEGNGLEKELEAFRLLKPEKGKKYLDYGCGRWSGTVKLLREQGYNVYGYEPYAAETGNPYIITGKEEVSRMRFDGIFSNDLVEHLFDPIEDFKFMRTLLRDKDSKMSHSTACFGYHYEYTRFHMNFPIGDAAKVLAERSGFELTERFDEMEEKDLICCIFSVADKESFVSSKGDEGTELLDKLFFKGERLTGKKTCALEKGDVMFGPYITCGAMSYKLRVYAVTAEPLNYKITSLKGANLIKEGTLSYGSNEISFECEREEFDTEFIFENPNADEAVIKSIMLV